MPWDLKSLTHLNMKSWAVKMLFRMHSKSFSGLQGIPYCSNIFYIRMYVFSGCLPTFNVVFGRNYLLRNEFPIRQYSIKIVTMQNTISLYGPSRDIHGK